MITEEQKAEVAGLYRRLAKHLGWPLPATWIEDREPIVNNIDSALVCLRHLVAEYGA